MKFDTILQQEQEKYKVPPQKPKDKQKPPLKKEVQLSNLKQIKAQYPQK
jgi:hypothetical protein